MLTVHIIRRERWFVNRIVTENKTGIVTENKTGRVYFMDTLP